MILLVSGANETVREYGGGDLVGSLLTPRSGNSVKRLADSGLVWGADNDCFNGLNPDEYLEMLDKIYKQDTTNLKFITVPDVVGDHHATAALFRYWYPALKRRELPAAFVTQDGASIDGIPWSDISALFVGGSTRWKLGPVSERIIKYAKLSGKWVHVGRVNTQERIRHCAALGVDSVDGSQFNRWRDTHIPWAIELLKQEHTYLWSQSI